MAERPMTVVVNPITEARDQVARLSRTHHLYALAAVRLIINAPR